jgi:GNAT superfamily N-acetyltransferase
VTNFRRAEVADLNALLQMQRVFYEHEGYPFDVPTASHAMRTLIENESLGRMLVIEHAGGAAGYLVVTFGYSLEFGGRDAFIDELFVMPNARGAGLGTRALAVAEQVCVDNGIRALHLEVEFVNESAKRLYTRSGYTEHTRHLMTKRFAR